jgi:hypothetical protein
MWHFPCDIAVRSFRCSGLFGFVIDSCIILKEFASFAFKIQFNSRIRDRKEWNLSNVATCTVSFDPNVNSEEVDRSRCAFVAFSFLDSMMWEYDLLDLERKGMDGPKNGWVDFPLGGGASVDVLPLFFTALVFSFTDIFPATIRTTNLDRNNSVNRDSVA